MRVTHFGHACVRIDADDAALVLDPGTLAQAASALAGATAVLVTHDHADHLDVAAVGEALAADAALEVWASGPAAAALVGAGVPPGRVHAVEPGQTFTLGAARVAVGGGAHALIHAAIPRAVNVTYLVEVGGRSVYHPGDSVDVPGRAVDVLLVPVSGPWLRLGEAIDYAAAVDARHLVPIHDAHASETGLALTGRLLGDPALAGPHMYTRLRPGETLTP